MSGTIKEIKTELLFESIKDLLTDNKHIKMRVTGNSMRPFLRHGIDSVELSHASFKDLKKGDLVLIQRDGGVYVMHRIININYEKEEFFMVGDAQIWMEGPIHPHQLRAKITGIYRGDVYIGAECPGYKTLVVLWRHLLPIRRYLIGILRRIQRWDKDL